ncbi:MAG: SDR family oxidoreductase [Proteobacteria bacterium]|nr:SDR family oxidoreductase [Pseudomonadota bacterium]
MNLLILGANSDVGYATARLFAERERANVYLASRNMDLLEKKATDIAIRHQIKATPLFFDATDYDTHQLFYTNLEIKPDIVVLCFGILGNQEDAQKNVSHAREVIDTNFTGALSILEVIAEDFEKRGHGVIIGISSVAGLRGRQSNYIYGAAKGALSTYLSGLRNRLAKRGVHVVTVLPGFINTKMTDGMDLPEKLTATPDQVALDIHKAFQKKKNIIYTRWFWKWIMLIIRGIPETIFKRLSL